MMPVKWFGAVFILLVGIYFRAAGAFVGVNIGTEVSSLPSPQEIVAILRAHNISHVRLFDADSEMLDALRGTGIDVVVGVTNDEVLGIGQHPDVAATWVYKNILRRVPSTNITAITVGSEVLSTIPAAAPVLVDAMQNLHDALVAANLNFQVKVSTPHSMDIIAKTFPPSAANFNNTWNATLYQILQFLKNTNSSFMLNAYPYYGYVQGNGIFPIDYALFQPLPSVKQIVDPNTLLHYDSMFDAMVDAAYCSIKNLGFSGIPVLVSESGWPSHGGPHEPDATIDNAETFNNNLIQRVSNGSGPPSQVNMPLNTYIYELFNEDKRSGPVSEKNWGLFFTNGSAVYSLKLTASGQVTGNSSAAFCVAKETADQKKLQDGLNWACGQGRADCRAIQPGKSCYAPNTLPAHASYAYNDYFTKQKGSGATCDFGGTGILTNVDPSNGSCIYAGSAKSNSSLGMTAPVAFGPVDAVGGSSILQVPMVGPPLLTLFIALVFL